MKPDDKGRGGPYLFPMLEDYLNRARQRAAQLLALWRGWPTRRRRLAKIWTGALGLLLLALVTLPDAGLRWGLFETMRKLGMTEISLSDAEVKLFDGRLVIKSFVAHSALGKALGLEHLDFAFRWTPLLKRQISVQTLDLSGLSVSVEREAKRIVINGAVIDLGGDGSGGGGWSFDVDNFRLTNSKIELADGGMRLAVDVELLEIRSLKSAEPETMAEIAFKGRIDGSRVELAGKLAPFASSPRLDLAFDLKDFDLAGLKPLLAQEGVDDAQGRLNAHLRLEGGGPERLAAQGTLAFPVLSLATAKSKLEAAGVSLAADDLVWNGKGGTLVWQGALSADSLSLSGDNLSAEPKRLSWQGKAEARLDGPRMAFNIDGKLSDAGTRIDTGAIDYRHGALALALSLAVETGQGAATRLSGQLGLDGSAMLLKDKISKTELVNAPKLSAGTIRIDKAAFHPDGAADAEALILEDLVLKLVRTKDPPAKPTETAQTEEPAAKKKDVGPRFVLGRFAIQGKSSLQFVDRSPSRPVELAADRLSVSLKGLDSYKPDRDSPFEMEARVGNATLAATGWARPFADKLTARLDTRVKAFELPPLSPYMADSLGVELQTGHFDGDIKLALDQGAIDGKLDLALSNLFAAQPDPDAPISRQTGMPVELLLDLLRGDDDRIKLSVPLSGNLADPKFDLSDAVAQAVGGALKHTAVATLKLVFPVLLLIDEIADQQGPALAPITFKPGAEEIDGPGQTRLKAIADLMKGRPGLKISLCPKTSAESDWPAILEKRKQDELGLVYKMQKLVGAQAKPEKTPMDQEAMTSLAERRAQAVKDQLIDGAGIDAGRLFACRPQMDVGVKALPRVDPML